MDLPCGGFMDRKGSRIENIDERLHLQACWDTLPIVTIARRIVKEP